MLSDTAFYLLSSSGCPQNDPGCVLAWMVGGINMSPSIGAVKSEEELAHQGHSLSDATWNPQNMLIPGETWCSALL